MQWHLIAASLAAFALIVDGVRVVKTRQKQTSPHKDKVTLAMSTRKQATEEDPKHPDGFVCPYAHGCPNRVALAEVDVEGDEIGAAWKNNGDLAEESVIAEMRGERAATKARHRRAAGQRLGASFPEYNMPRDYVDPLTGTGRAYENTIMHFFSETTYTNYLRELSEPTSRSLQVSTRNTENKEATRQTVGWLQQAFKDTGATTCVQAFQVDRGRADIYNVIAFVPGTQSGSVTIGAHFDDLPGAGSSAPGAEDDGSGTAGVLTALHAFMRSGAKPKKSLYFVAFGGEEQNLYGSSHFASELRNPGSSNAPIPSACRLARTTSDHTAFTMDMIGYRNPSFSTDTVLIETRTEALCKPLVLANQVVNNGRLKVLFSLDPFGSDHMSFIDNGLPATLVIDNDGDVYKYGCYHKSCDKMQNLDMGFATAIARMNLGGALRVAGISA